MLDLKRHKVRFLKSLLLMVSFFLFGMCMIIPGPAILDLQLLTSASLEEINYLFPLSAVGYIIGSIITGFLFNKVNAILLLGVTTMGLGIGTLAMPMIRSVYAVIAWYMLVSFAAAGVDTAGNPWIVRMWGNDAAPFLQAIQLCYGIGGLIAPLIVEPYLVPSVENNQVHNSTSTLEHTADDVALQIPFGIIGCVSVGVALVYVGIYFYKPYETVHPSREQTFPGLKMRGRVIFLFFASTLMLCMAGLNIVFPRYLTAYAATGPLKLTKSTGAFMTSTYWACYSSFRLFNIYLVKKFTPKQMISVQSVTMLLGAALLWIFGGGYPVFSEGDLLRKAVTGFWAGIVIIGTGASSIIPCFYSFMEGYVSLSGPIMAVLITAYSIGEFIFPLIVSHFIESLPEIIIYVTDCSVLGSAVTLFTVMAIAHKLASIDKSDLPKVISVN